MRDSKTKIGIKLPGFLRDNGNFIFYVDVKARIGKGKTRKLVETTNWGEKSGPIRKHYIYSNDKRSWITGELSLPAADWKDPEKWSRVNGRGMYLDIINFIGERGMKNSKFVFHSRR